MRPSWRAVAGLAVGALLGLLWVLWPVLGPLVRAWRRDRDAAREAGWRLREELRRPVEVGRPPWAMGPGIEPRSWWCGPCARLVRSHELAGHETTPAHREAAGGDYWSGA